ncbi:hypothetical protein [Umezawaea beigongshangensis]|uniref:hypothetical protein n=1 Tax=Umezawaea beigongshangensis TaxID=2780383 RepID=UPI0018F2475B|nr:hypothetical protein [Umezawaea beigongshangensis]
MMLAHHLTVAQWWMVAGAVAALTPLAMYYLTRNLKAALYGVLIPLAGWGALAGTVHGDHAAIESLVMY